MTQTWPKPEDGWVPILTTSTTIGDDAGSSLLFFNTEGGVMTWTQGRWSQDFKPEGHC